MDHYRCFIETEIFTRKWASYNLTEEDLETLQNLIIEKPDRGDLVVGTGGLRKMRFALPGRGKSGGVRVGYVDFIVAETVVLIDVFAKNEKANFTDSEKANLKNIIRMIKGEIGGKK